MKKVISAAVLVLIVSSAAFAQTNSINLGNFASGGTSGWNVEGWPASGGWEPNGDSTPLKQLCPLTA